LEELKDVGVKIFGKRELMDCKPVRKNGGNDFLKLRIAEGIVFGVFADKLVK
jgi:hypothetical protein